VWNASACASTASRRPLREDVDFSHRQIVVRDGKGLRDRLTMLPESLIPALRERLQRVRLLHDQGLQEDHGGVSVGEGGTGGDDLGTAKAGGVFIPLGRQA